MYFAKSPIQLDVLITVDEPHVVKEAESQLSENQKQISILTKIRITLWCSWIEEISSKTDYMYALLIETVKTSCATHLNEFIN